MLPSTYAHAAEDGGWDFGKPPTQVSVLQERLAHAEAQLAVSQQAYKAVRKMLTERTAERNSANADANLARERAFRLLNQLGAIRQMAKES